MIETAAAPLAQLAEQLTLNQWVPGSSPGGCTTQKTPSLSAKARKRRGFFMLRSGQGQRLEFAVALPLQLPVLMVLNLQDIALFPLGPVGPVITGPYPERNLVVGLFVTLSVFDLVLALDGYGLVATPEHLRET
jgi:hypothetical protein